MSHAKHWTCLLFCLFLFSCDGASSEVAGSPVANPAPDGPLTVATAGVIRGVIELDPASQAALASYRCIFLLGWRGERSGTAQLVRKLPADTLPVRFELDARDLMGPGTLSGEWTLLARLDADGDAAPRRGDIEGVLAGATADGPTARVVIARTLTADDERPLQLEGSGHGADPFLGRRVVQGSDAAGLPAGHPAVAPAGLPAGHPPTGGSAGSRGVDPDDHSGHDHAHDGEHAHEHEHAEGADPTGVAGDAGAAGEAGAPATAEGAATDTATNPRIRGTLQLGSAFAALDGTRTLFVIVKDSTADRGMPRAVLKLERPRFPLDFDIGIEHIPLQVENKADLLQGQLYITARLDGDGTIMKAAGDIELAAPLEVTAGGEPLTAVLDTERKQ